MSHSLCFAIYDKVIGEKFGTHVQQLLEHKPLVILFARLSLFSLLYSGIPVTMSHCFWPDYNGYRHTEWARSKYLFIVKEQIPVRTIAVTRHTIQCTQNLFYYFPVTGRFI